MTKIIRAKAKGYDYVNILVPDVHTLSFIKKKVITYLDIFYSYVRYLIKKGKITERSKEAINRTMIELDGKIIAVKHIAKILVKEERKLIMSKNSHKIRTYKQHQVFLGLLTAYLDAVHSLKDMVVSIDHLLEKNYSEKIWEQDWFRMNVDIRNVLHHQCSPILTVVNDKIVISIMPSRIKKLWGLRFFKKKELPLTDKTPMEMEVDCVDFGTEEIKALNEWALAYLKLLNENETVDVISGFRKDGGMKQVKLLLKDLLRMV